jgi:hypothetical protein
VRVVSAETDLLDRFEVVVDPDAEPADLDRFLDALDRLVERRLKQRNQTTSAGTPAAEVDP